PQAHHAADDKGDPEELARVQSLPKEQGTQDDDSDARDGRPDRIANPDVEGQQGKAEEIGGDRPADQGDGGPARSGESSCVSCGNGDRDFKDYGHAQIEPAHGGFSFGCRVRAVGRRKTGAQMRCGGGDGSCSRPLPSRSIAFPSASAVAMPRNTWSPTTSVGTEVIRMSSRAWRNAAWWRWT